MPALRAQKAPPKCADRGDGFIKRGHWVAGPFHPPPLQNRLLEERSFPKERELQTNPHTD